MDDKLLVLFLACAVGPVVSDVTGEWSQATTQKPPTIPEPSTTIVTPGSSTETPTTSTESRTNTTAEPTSEPSTGTPTLVPSEPNTTTATPGSSTETPTTNEPLPSSTALPSPTTKPTEEPPVQRGTEKSLSLIGGVLTAASLMAIGFSFVWLMSRCCTAKNRPAYKPL